MVISMPWSCILTCRFVFSDTDCVIYCWILYIFRLGGPDPLDYISMYANAGDPEKGVPAHWHYISFGLSDLHGDGRVHE